MSSLMLVNKNRIQAFYKSVYGLEKQTLKKNYHDSVCLWGKKTLIMEVLSPINS